MHKEGTIIVGIQEGLHARPAALFVRLVKSHDKVEVEVRSAEKSANAKSIMEVMSLGVSFGNSVDLIVTGENADVVFAHLQSFLQATP